MKSKLMLIKNKKQKFDESTSKQLRGRPLQILNPVLLQNAGLFNNILH